MSNKIFNRTISFFIAFIMIITNVVYTGYTADAIEKNSINNPIKFDENDKVNFPDYPEQGAIKLDKTAQWVDKDENIAKVELTVEGALGNNDIVLVIDRSGSMRVELPKDTSDQDSYVKTRLDIVKDSAKVFVEKLLGSSTDKNLNRIAVVSYSGKIDDLPIVSTDSALTNDVETLNSAIDSISPYGGTNIQSGIKRAHDILKSSTAKNKYVIVLSDGEATYSYKANSIRNATEEDYKLNYPTDLNFVLNDFDETAVLGSANFYENYGDHVYELDGIKISNNGVPTLSQALLAKEDNIEIYSIGFLIGGDHDKHKKARYIMEHIATDKEHYYLADNLDIVETYSKIAQKISDNITDKVSVAASNAVVKDNMGEDIELGYNFTVIENDKYPITVTNGKAAVSEDKKTIDWDLGDSNTGGDITETPSKLTYYVKLNVADDKFIDDSIELKTNNNAAVIYNNYIGNWCEMEFPIPVLKVEPVNYTLTVNYVYSDGSKVTKPHISDMKRGQSYSVTSSAIEGFTPDRKIVNGTMPNHDVVETVVYVKNNVMDTVKVIPYYQTDDNTGEYKRGENIYEINASSLTEEEINKYINDNHKTGYTYNKEMFKTDVTTKTSIYTVPITGTQMSMESSHTVYNLYYDKEKSSSDNKPDKPTIPNKPELDKPELDKPETDKPDTDKPSNKPDVEIPDSDIPSGELEKLDHFAYIIGYPEGDVRPQNNITRAEAATMFFRLLTDKSRDELWSKTNDFNDITINNWFNNAISTLDNANILNGYIDGTYKPNKPITRAEFAAIAARFDNLENLVDDKFTDISGHWAEKYINSAVAKGWIKGYDDGTFKPNQNITRAEAMQLVNNVLNRKVDKNGMIPTMKTWSDNTPDKWFYETVQEATNSHLYKRDEKTGMEIWTEIKPVRDWNALEK